MAQLTVQTNLKTLRVIVTLIANRVAIFRTLHFKPQLSRWWQQLKVSAMKVLKFGGTSVATAEAIERVIEISGSRLEDGNVAVVVSALGGITDGLIRSSELAAEGEEEYLTVLEPIEQRHAEVITNLLSGEQQHTTQANIDSMLGELRDILRGIYLVRECSPRTLDMVQSLGERMSSYIISEAFKACGVDACLLDSRELITTDRNFGKATVDFEITNADIRDRFDTASALAVMPGFVAYSQEGETTTLGRGGSDYTASIVAAALTADALEIWTDVSGMMTADPRKVKKAFPIERITFKEALELSHFGAKVLYPPSVQPVLDQHIPLWIKNTFAPEDHGTLLTIDAEEDSTAIRGISSIEEVALLSLNGAGMVGVPGFSRRLFGALAQEEINIILITQASSEHSITFGIEPAGAARACNAVNKEFEYEISLNKVAPLEVEEHLSIIALVGDNMRNQVGTSGTMFSTLGRNGINIRAIAQGSSERNISCVIPSRDVKKALNVLHESFFLSDTKRISLFLVGVGNVGSAFIDQVKQQQEYLREAGGIDLRVVGMANSRKMLIEEEGVDLSRWAEALDSEGTPSSLEGFIEQMKALNLRNSVFIDNTASDIVAGTYQGVMAANVNVVTPNKIAAADSVAVYQELHATARKYNVKYLYETNVGAGLPVISTLKDLIRSGDRVQKIQAVLSGSLNFIFNNLAADRSFADVVRQAQDEGYTEPDPRIDLSGKDVMRKILILARDSGTPMEFDEVGNNSFLPEACQATDSVDAFYASLEANQAHFEALRATAEAAGERLKFVATFADGAASVGLQSFPASHPFYNLDGKDNIVLFTTDRYPDQPLVVKGAGAGAAVTASGVFADVIRIANI